jgi:hypothetical protein
MHRQRMAAEICFGEQEATGVRHRAADTQTTLAACWGLADEAHPSLGTTDRSCSSCARTPVQDEV